MLLWVWKDVTFPSLLLFQVERYNAVQLWYGFMTRMLRRRKWLTPCLQANRENKVPLLPCCTPSGHINWGLAHLHCDHSKTNTTSVDMQWALTCLSSLLISHSSCLGLCFKMAFCVALLLWKLMDDLKPRPEGGELCGQHFQVSCRFSPAADPLRQLPSASACEILELSLSTILPVLWYLS